MSIRQTKNPAWISNDWLTATLTLQAPSGADTDFVDLHYSVVMHRVVSHPALLYLRHDVRAGVLGDSPVLIGTFAFGTPHVVIDAAGHSWWLGFRHLFRLGVRHIAEGTDHLLFLLTLLLPAPLVACRRRWRARGDGWRSAVSVVKIVSGFTVGHSLTLGLAACGLVSVPAKVVEVAIALSVLVSAVHALRPLFPGREAWVAAGFGLIHGLAFAEMLSGLQFDPTSLLVGLAAFNLGIETMQLAVVAVAVPLLLLASRHTGYGWLRVLLALVAAACAAAWIGERLLGLDNPLSPVLAWLAQPPPLLLILLASASGLAAALELLMPIRLRSEPSEKKLSARSAP